MKERCRRKLGWKRLKMAIAEYLKLPDMTGENGWGQNHRTRNGKRD